MSLPAAPIPEGHGRVVLYTTDGPMRIEARADTTFIPPGGGVQPTQSGELCTTPCIVDLPPGKYKFYLTAADGSYSQGDTDTLVVREGLNYYSRAPGKYEPAEWIHILPSLVIIAGAVLLATGIVLTGSDDSSQQTLGAVIAGGGIAIGIGGGIWLYDESRGSTQAGATTSWWQPAP